MISNELTETVLALSEEDRLELARRLIESVGTEAETEALVREGVQRIEDIATGCAAALTENEFRSALR